MLRDYDEDENLAEKAEQLIKLKKAFDQAVYIQAKESVEDEDAE